MIRLQTLGGLSVADSGTMGKAAVQPKRLAVLAVLAYAEDNGLARESIVELLWSGQPTEAARHSLTQTLYALRRDLGVHRLVTGTSRLALDRTTIGVDLWDFRDAVRRQDWDEAVTLFKGPYLDGFFLDEAPAFDQWLDGTRRQLDLEFMHAATSLATAATARSDHTLALTCWQRVATSDPYNAGVMASLARAMRATGDRVGPVNAIHAFGERLRADLALPLDIDLIRLADTMRQEIRDRPGEPPSPLPAEPPAGPPRPAAQKRPLLRWGLVGMAAVVGFTAAIRTWQAPRLTDTDATIRVEVLPFAIHGDSAAAYLGAGLARLIVGGLDGAGSVRASETPGVAPALAEIRSAQDSADLLVARTGSHRFVTGSATVVGDTIQVQATLWDARRRIPIGTGVATGAHANFFAVADDVSRRLLGLITGDGVPQLARTASEATRSLAAFKWYVEGEAAFRAGRFNDAVGAFQRAVREDSTFGLGYLALSEAADWNGDMPLVRGAAAAAARYADRLAWRDRLLLEGSSAWRAGENDLAESRARAIVTRYPGDAAAWFLLGEVLFHSNTIRGRGFEDARDPFERVVALDPNNSATLTHLARLAAYREDPRAVDSLLGRAASLMSDGPNAEVALFRAVVSGDSKARTAALAALGSQAGFVLHDAADRLAGYAKNLPAAEAVVRLMETRQTDDFKAFGHLMAAELAAAGGQPGRAMAAAAAAAEYDSPYGLEIRAYLATLPIPLVTAAERASIFRQLEAWSPERQPSSERVAWAIHQEIHPAIRWYLLALLSTQTGDTARASRYADSLDQIPAATRQGALARAYAGSVRAHMLAAAGRAGDALAALATLPRPGDQELQAFLVASLQSERFLRARLLERSGRAEEAAVVYQSMMFGGRHELVLAAPAALNRARLMAQLGRPEAARKDYRTFLATWSRPDPVFRSAVDSARAELSRLR